MEDKKQVPTGLITRVMTDLQKEIVRTDNETVRVELEGLVEGLKELKKELDDFRILKRIIKT